jgi:hypothetical protein
MFGICRGAWRHERVACTAPAHSPPLDHHHHSLGSNHGQSPISTPSEHLGRPPVRFLRVRARNGDGWVAGRPDDALAW